MQKKFYRADEVIADTKIRDQLKSFEDAGYGDFPICIAKTQYSFSTDPSLKGAPTGHSLPIREIKLSSGAEVYCCYMWSCYDDAWVTKSSSSRFN